MEYSSHCRLCLKQNENLEDIFSSPSGSEYSLPGSIYMFFGIEINKEDQSSHLVCPNCLKVIQYIHLYRNKFRTNQNNSISNLKDNRLSSPELHQNKTYKKYPLFKNITHKTYDCKNIPENLLGNPQIVISKHDRDIAEKYLEKCVSPVRRNSLHPQPDFSDNNCYNTNHSEIFIRNENVDENIKESEAVADPSALNNLEDEPSNNDLVNNEMNNDNFFDTTKSKSVYVCNVCAEVFDSKRVLKMHKESDHSNIPFII